MGKIEYIYSSVDDFGLITSAEAADLGMSNAELVQQAQKGRLVRVARGVYRMPVWPSQPEAPYAVAVKAAGEGAFLYGESVVALLQLAPTDPSKMWVASPKRVRRSLGEGVRLVRVPDAEPVWLEGVLCQPLSEALICASKTMGVARAWQAALEARAEGYVSDAELTSLRERLA